MFFNKKTIIKNATFKFSTEEENTHELLLVGFQDYYIITYKVNGKLLPNSEVTINQTNVKISDEAKDARDVEMCVLEAAISTFTEMCEEIKQLGE